MSQTDRLGSLPHHGSIWLGIKPSLETSLAPSLATSTAEQRADIDALISPALLHQSFSDSSEFAVIGPRLDEDLQVDVAIIGAGITGLTTAAQLRGAGLKVVVLEAGRIGAGTSGCSTGNLYATVDSRLHKLMQVWGTERGTAVVASRVGAINLIERYVGEYALDCDFSRQPWVLYSTEGQADESADIEAEFHAAQIAGLDARLALDLPLPYMIRKALVIRHQAQFHPVRYLRGLAAALQGPDCRIFENTPVTSIDSVAGRIYAAQHSVQAGQIVMATHVPKGHDFVQFEMAAYREYAVAAPVERDQLPGGMFWSTGSRPTSARTLHLDGQSYVLLVGERHKTGQNPEADSCFQILEARLQSRFHVHPVRYTWSAQHYCPADGLPYIGASAQHPNVFIATGFAADGLVYGTLAGQIISQAIRGNEHSWAALYSPNRFTPIKSARSILRENFNVAGQYLRDYVRRPSLKALDMLPAGEGAVLDLQGDKVAAFRDERGGLHLCAAMCTHMKCIVHWNRAERSWDCPCHGSRFSIDGAVLEGPALMPLPTIR